MHASHCADSAQRDDRVDLGAKGHFTKVKLGCELPQAPWSAGGAVPSRTQPVVAARSARQDCVRVPGARGGGGGRARGLGLGVGARGVGLGGGGLCARPRSPAGATVPRPCRQRALALLTRLGEKASAGGPILALPCFADTRKRRQLHARFPSNPGGRLSCGRGTGRAQRPPPCHPPPLAPTPNPSPPRAAPPRCFAAPGERRASKSDQGAIAGSLLFGPYAHTQLRFSEMALGSHARLGSRTYATR